MNVVTPSGGPSAHERNVGQGRAARNAGMSGDSRTPDGRALTGRPVPPTPFTGIRVVEMCTSIGGLTAGALLAGLGAEVVQVGAAPDSSPLRVWADRAKVASGID